MRKTYQILAALSVAAAGSVATAAPLVIDHDGAGPLAPVLTNTWDWQPGNALATDTTSGESAVTVGGNRAVSNFVANTGAKSFDLLYQARMATVLDQGGNIINTVTSQLNVAGSGFEITVVAGFKEDIAAVVAGTVIFANPAVAGLNYFEVYFDKLDGSTGGVPSNNLTGQGFNDGRLIARGNISVVNSLFSALAGTGDLDQFGGVDNYPGLDTINGQGVTTLVAQLETGDFDPTFFPNIVANPLGADLTFELFTSTQTTPFVTSDPGAAFSFGANPAAVGTNSAGIAETTAGAGLGAGNMTTLGLGTINGLQPAGIVGGGGESTQFQADASNTFLARQDFGIPEPTTAILGLMGLAGLARRRRTA